MKFETGKCIFHRSRDKYENILLWRLLVLNHHARAGMTKVMELPKNKMRLPSNSFAPIANYGKMLYVEVYFFR